MQIPLQITLRNIAHSDAVEAAIRKRVEKLDRYRKHIVSCRVVVEIPSRHRQQGKEFVVRLDIKVPGNEIAINHDHHEDVYRALQDAFLAARRKLEDHDRRHAGSLHSAPDAEEPARIVDDAPAGVGSPGTELEFAL